MFSWFRKDKQNVSTETSKPQVIPDSVVATDQEKETTVEHQASTGLSVGPEPNTLSPSSSGSVFSWFWRNKAPPGLDDAAAKSGGVTEELKDRLTDKQCNSSGDLTNIPDKLRLEDDGFAPDPNVVEFFKDFPEYYREKAIRRYSSRRGLFRFDIIRNWKMQEEMRHALQGQFLEAQREKEALTQQHRLERLESYSRETRSKREEEGIPEWEKFFLQYFPLQDGEFMIKKLALAVNLSACGLCTLHFGLNYKKRNPKKNLGIGKWRLVIRGIAGAATCICFQYFALCRLYDWGYYDNTFDKRPVLDKIIDKNVKDLENGLDALLDYIDPPTAEVKSLDSAQGKDKS